MSEPLDAIMVASPRPWSHPSYDAVRILVESLAAQGVRRAKTSWVVGQIVKRIPLVRFGAVRRNVIIVPMIDRQFATLAAAHLRGRPVVFAWDVWESAIDDWARQLASFGASIIVTSRASEALLRGSSFEGDVHYLPDAIRTSDYNRGPELAARSVGLLELGRRHQEWHESIVGAVGDARHLYETAPGQVIFSGRADLIAGLADAAVSVCFPRSMTHPDSAGGVETLTQRYLESIASGCLLVGHAPQDMIDLFGYNPVIEVDWDAPADQLAEILSNLASYQEVVDRNYQRLLEVGDWAVRTEAILQIAAGHNQVKARTA